MFWQLLYNEHAEIVVVHPQALSCFLKLFCCIVTPSRNGIGLQYTGTVDCSINAQCMSTTLRLITLEVSTHGAQPKLVRDDLVQRLDHMEQLLHFAL